MIKSHCQNQNKEYYKYLTKEFSKLMTLSSLHFKSLNKDEGINLEIFVFFLEVFQELQSNQELSVEFLIYCL